jgi:hypothetical protein
VPWPASGTGPSSLVPDAGVVATDESHCLVRSWPTDARDVLRRISGARSVFGNDHDAAHGRPPTRSATPCSASPESKGIPYCRMDGLRRLARIVVPQHWKMRHAARSMTLRGEGFVGGACPRRVRTTSQLFPGKLFSRRPHTRIFLPFRWRCPARVWNKNRCGGVSV